MAVDLENDEVFSAAVEGLPRVVELIGTVPEEKRFVAWSAARQSYLQTAQTLGYDGSDAQEWASAIMSRVEISDQILPFEERAKLVAKLRKGVS
jgi:hypothetical protein